MNRTTPRNDKHRHNHYTDAAGRVWVTRSISRCKVIPGYKAIDPLTVPLWDRPTVWARYAKFHMLASDERNHLREAVKLVRSKQHHD